MDAFDFLGEQIVATPAGRVAVSLAGHDDGAVSVVAWLVATGRRVGYLYSRPRSPRPQEAIIDPLLDGTVVQPLMETLLDQAIGRRPADEPVGRRLVRAGLMSAEQVDDLLGWQWLLAEMGQEHHLGELAVQAGLLAEATADLLGQRVERRDPAPRLLPPLAMPVEPVALGA